MIRPGPAGHGGARSGMAGPGDRPRRRARRRGSPTGRYRLPRADLARQRTIQAMTLHLGAIAPRRTLTFRCAMLRPPWAHLAGRRERTWRRGRGAGADLTGRITRMASGRRGSQQARGQRPPGRRFRSADFQPFSAVFQPFPAVLSQKTPKQPKWKTAHHWRDGPGQASRPPEVGPLGQAGRPARRATSSDATYFTGGPQETGRQNVSIISTFILDMRSRPDKGGNCNKVEKSFRRRAGRADRASVGLWGRSGGLIANWGKKN